MTDPITNVVDDEEMEDVCLQCKSRQNSETLVFKSAMRKIAFLTAVCAILCVLTVTACGCSLYFYTRFQGFRQDLEKLVVQMDYEDTEDIFDDHFTMEHNAMPMYGESLDDDDSQYKSENTRRVRHRRKGKAKKGKGKKCSRKKLRTCDCCKTKLAQYIDTQIESKSKMIAKTEAPVISTQATSTPKEEATKENLHTYLSAAHYTTFVDETYIDKQFGHLEHDFHNNPPNMQKNIPEWQGTLYRNRTFVTTAAPLTLRFFKEADWMKTSRTEKIFDFDNTTGKFMAKHTGLYHLYAHAQFRISRDQGISMVHRTPSGFEILNMFHCGTNETVVGLRGIGKPCTLGGVVQINERETVEIVLLDDETIISLNPDHMYFGAILLMYS